VPLCWADVWVMHEASDVPGSSGLSPKQKAAVDKPSEELQVYEPRDLKLSSGLQELPCAYLQRSAP